MRRPLSLALIVSALVGCRADRVPPTATALDDGTGMSAIPAGPYTPGTSYFGRNSYIEYIAGNLPVIFAAPHGGTLTPAEIPNRTASACGGEATTVRDANTEELARAIRTAFHDRTGGYPHVIINRLHRQKLDANRPQSDGACGDAEANIAWDEFQDFIDVAKARVTADNGKGWFTDLHGHGHAIQRLELGYMLEGADLRLSNATLDGSGAYEDESSFRVFSEQSTAPFSALLRGNVGLGTLFANAGYPAVPSLQDMQPDEGESYFSGGYNTGVHGCSSGGSICGLQIEHNNAGVRDDATNRANYAAALAKVYETYLAQNFGISLYSTGGEILVDNVNANNDTTRARFQASANWATNTNNTQKHLNDFALTDGDGPTNDGAAFLFRIASPGSHSVYAWWPSASSRTTSASYRVFALDGGTMLFDGVRNQQTNGGQWNLLGTWTFPQAGWAKVLVSRSLSGPGKLAADAVRIVRH